MNNLCARLKNFHNGNDFKAYELFGCHYSDGGKYVFRVWAPRAASVHLNGIFSESEKTFPMQKLCDNESWEVEVFAKAGDKYAFIIETADGRKLFKSDPYAFKSDLPVSKYSVVCDLPDFAGSDRLREPHRYDLPVNIYEVNLLSWKRHLDGSYYSYKELAEELVPYVKSMGYTHVEFMPVTEYPFDGSWGYQVTGYFSVTSRLGSPDEFKMLVDAFHSAGIGVILDWVPAHFPKDAWGLYEFDGQPLYECPLWDRMEHYGWGTRRFDYGKYEIDNFLLSSACFFLAVYGIDGLRVDAVASMIYLNYDRADGDFTPNIYDGCENLEGIAFLKKFNSAIKSEFPAAVTVAEESTAFPKVTGKVSDGGLGFDYKWNMGWMNDVLFYCRQDPYFRNYHHDKMTFSLVYAFSERFILPVSHDEVVHVKGSLVNKMSGEYADKFAGERLFLAFMYAHPGKKLNFMGYEVAQFKEWDYNSGVDFFLADEYEMHSKMRVFVKALNKIYSKHESLYSVDFDWNGFEWLVVDDKFNNLFAFARTGKNGEKIIAVMNFSGVDLIKYSVSTENAKYKLILNTDDREYGGSGKLRKKTFNSVKRTDGSGGYAIAINVPRLSCLYFIKEK